MKVQGLIELLKAISLTTKHYKKAEKQTDSVASALSPHFKIKFYSTSPSFSKNILIPRSGSITW